MPAPTFKEALQKFFGKQAITTSLTSAELSTLPSALRDRALFSARVTQAQIVQRLGDQIGELLEAKTDPATARLAMKNFLKSIDYQPEEKDRGTIKDLSSDARINLQLKQNVESAQGYGNWVQGQADGALDAFPAQELYRLEAREEPRDWPTIWNGARGELGASSTAADARIAMIALKADPIWTAISEFGVPWPPFAFNSGMWVRDIDRDQAEELGLLDRGQPPPTNIESFNRDLEAGTKGLAPSFLDALKAQFGDQIEVVEGAIKWRGQ
jgi:hypothetical protein